MIDHDEAKKSASVVLMDRTVPFRIKSVRRGGNVRARVGPSGVEVLLPAAEREDRAAGFLRDNADWVLSQIDRVERLPDRAVRPTLPPHHLLLYGVPTRVRVTVRTGGLNRVTHEDGEIAILHGRQATTPPVRSLGNWLRKQARVRLARSVARIGRGSVETHARLHVRDQRTRWGACSIKTRTLSFNWRLVMAPPSVLDYVVRHELVHLTFPDHSRKFWLAVRERCPRHADHERWLRQYAVTLRRELDEVVSSAPGT